MPREIKKSTNQKNYERPLSNSISGARLTQSSRDEIYAQQQENESNNATTREYLKILIMRKMNAQRRTRFSHQCLIGSASNPRR